MTSPVLSPQQSNLDLHEVIEENQKKREREKDDISTVEEDSEPPKKKRRVKKPNPFTSGPDTHHFIQIVNLPEEEVQMALEQLQDHCKTINVLYDVSKIDCPRLWAKKIDPSLIRLSLNSDEKRERDIASRQKYAKKPETIEKRKKLYESEEYKRAKAEALKNPVIQEQKKISQKANRLLLKEFKTQDRKAYEARRAEIRKRLEESQK